MAQHLLKSLSSKFPRLTRWFDEEADDPTPFAEFHPLREVRAMSLLPLTAFGPESAHLARATSRDTLPGQANHRQGGVQGEARVDVFTSRAMLASLYARLDDASVVAMKERTASGGDPSQGNPEEFRKLFPPYPKAYAERAAYLDRLAGLAPLSDALRPPETREEMDRLAQAVSAGLAELPNTGVTRRPVHFLMTTPKETP